MNDDLSDEERSAQVRGALLKALGVVVVIGVLIFLGTTIMVRALGLNDGSDTGPVGAAARRADRAAPDHGAARPRGRGKPDDEPSESESPDAGQPGRIELAISPVLARPMERVNFTGTYKGADNLQLEVQRFEDGEWSDFGVQATVRVGTFETYIMTGRTGENRFRVFDPEHRGGQQRHPGDDRLSERFPPGVRETDGWRRSLPASRQNPRTSGETVTDSARDVVEGVRVRAGAAVLAAVAAR